MLFTVLVVFSLLLFVSGECRGDGVPGSLDSGDLGYRGTRVQEIRGAGKSGCQGGRNAADPEWWGFGGQGCPVCRDCGAQGSPRRRAARVPRIWSEGLPGVQGIRGAGESEFQGIQNTGEPGMLGMWDARDPGCRG